MVTGVAGANPQTLTAGCRGIKSITETSTGTYSMVLFEVGEYYIGSWFNFLGVAGAATAWSAKPISYTASTKTIVFETFDNGATPALIDLTSAMQMSVRILFLDSDAP